MSLQRGNESGRRRHGAGECNHDSAGAGGSSCSLAMCNLWYSNHVATDGPLLTLQVVDTAHDQIVFLAYSAPGGGCDNMILELKLTTNLVQGNGFGVEVKEPDGKWQELGGESMATFFSVDNARASVTMVSWGCVKKCMKWSCRNSTRTTQKRA